MKITATPNRRIRRCQRGIWLPTCWPAPLPQSLFHGGNTLQLNYYLDQQSARIARRCNLKQFAGVPAAGRRLGPSDPRHAFWRSRPGCIAGLCIPRSNLCEEARRIIAHNMSQAR